MSDDASAPAVADVVPAPAAEPTTAAAAEPVAVATVAAEPTAASADVADVGESAEPVMSKNARKRAEKTAKFLATKDARRQAERDKKKAKKAALAARRLAGEDVSLPALPSDLFKRKHRQDESTLRALMADPDAPAIVIDCGYDDVMRNAEVVSMALQVTHSYGACSRARSPVHLIVAGVDPNAAPAVHRDNKDADADAPPVTTAAVLRQRKQDLVAWQATVSPLSLGALFPPGSPQRARLVYLCAESDTELSALYEGEEAAIAAADAEAAAAAAAGAAPPKIVCPDLGRGGPIYVIGGLVDHNRLPGAAKARAALLGIPTARLPLAKYMPATKTTRQVMTVVAVVEMILARRVATDWAKALEAVVPTRWQGAKEEKAAADGGAEGSDDDGSESEGDEGDAKEA